MKTAFFTLVILVLSSLSIGCTSILPSAHKIDIQQGNAIKAEDLDKLSIGMSKKQVSFLIGTPLIRDMFHANRWDYVYSFKAGATGKTKTMRLTLIFNGDVLSKIDNINYVPET